MSDVAYILCALTAVCCAVLLLRGYKQSRSRLLFWSGLFFIGLALNNILLLLDHSVFLYSDLSLVRSLPVLAGLFLLLYGLIWERR